MKTPDICLPSKSSDDYLSLMKLAQELFGIKYGEVTFIFHDGKVQFLRYEGRIKVDDLNQNKKIK